ncbi:hypothetical protein I302_100990 [Kwoniella bestiolae CBS 10118]|uniref:DUF2961 domain-containing protein n=1 Tax=Kwoniella bestiolae CBS 10118 TaxID=1296100 RepID=A0AAJ8K1F5_9TREE
MNRTDLLSAGAYRRNARTGRVSSWDHSGRNEDAFTVRPGESIVLADVEGQSSGLSFPFTGVAPYTATNCPFMETHRALGLFDEANDENFYRNVVIKIFWDDQTEPSVLAPLGDFFCIGQSMPANFSSLPFSVSVRPMDDHKYGGTSALNCYLTMPFNKRATIEVENQGDNTYIQYFYIDYELYPEPHGKDILYFHAMWKRENPTRGWAPSRMAANSREIQQPKNLDATGDSNYVILETEGAGNYLGCNHSITHMQGVWWGEGDDIIWIDDDSWPPSLHGTGGEDYFGQGWGMQKNAYPFCGTIIHEDDITNNQVSYRFHMADPIRFNKRIKVTMETGHANHLRDDWSTTAYWYQTLPGPKLSLPPPELRIPRKATISTEGISDPDVSAMSEQFKALLDAREERFKDYLKDRQVWIDRRADDSQERAKRNVEIAKEVRTRWMASLK